MKRMLCVWILHLVQFDLWFFMWLLFTLTMLWKCLIFAIKIKSATWGHVRSSLLMSPNSMPSAMDLGVGHSLNLVESEHFVLFFAWSENHCEHVKQIVVASCIDCLCHFSLCEWILDEDGMSLHTALIHDDWQSCAVVMFSCLINCHQWEASIGSIWVVQDDAFVQVWNAKTQECCSGRKLQCPNHIWPSTPFIP